jgi:hypothetical protein
MVLCHTSKICIPLIKAPPVIKIIFLFKFFYILILIRQRIGKVLLSCELNYKIQIYLILQSSNQPINLVNRLPGLPVNQLRLPHPDNSGLSMTENISPPPKSSPSRGRKCRKNLPLKGGGNARKVGYLR